MWLLLYFNKHIIRYHIKKLVRRLLVATLYLKIFLNFEMINILFIKIYII